jgi:hypothetical protein
MSKRIAAIFAAALAGGAMANDGIGQLGMGGIIDYGKTHAVLMRKETLEISVAQVKVDYEYVNESDQDVILPVVFPLPPYRAIEPSMSWAGQPPGFKLWVDGVERPFMTHVRATVAGSEATGTDVTETLRAAGLTDEQIALFPGVLSGSEVSPFALPFSAKTGKRVASLTKKQLQALRQAGLLVHGPSDEQDYPAWQVHVTYVWDMNFPAGKKVHVSHRYKPFRAVGAPAAGTPSDEEELKNQYCASDRLVSRLKSGWGKIMNNPANPNRNGYGIAGGRVDYILSTANTWKGPIRDFTLRLSKIAPDELISLCFPGDFSRVDALTLEAHLTDFVPTSELSVRFINPALVHGSAAAAAYSDGPNFELPKITRPGLPSAQRK